MIGSSHIIIKRKFICPDLRNLFVSTLVFVFLIVAIWWIYTSNLKKTRDAERYADHSQRWRFQDFRKKPIRAYVGYYLNRGLSGQVIVGSCYPEYEDQIMVVH